MHANGEDHRHGVHRVAQRQEDEAHSQIRKLELAIEARRHGVVRPLIRHGRHHQHQVQRGEPQGQPTGAQGGADAAADVAAPTPPFASSSSSSTSSSSRPEVSRMSIVSATTSPHSAPHIGAARGRRVPEIVVVVPPSCHHNHEPRRSGAT